MLNRTTALIVLLALALVLSGLGCSKEPESTAPAPSVDETAEQETPSEEAPVEAPDLSYLTGTWTVATELAEIDNAAMTPAADQPGATWECVVVGDTMQLNTDRHEYTGMLTSEADGGWLYEASATFTDEDGHAWTSTIEVHGKPENASLDSFVGSMTGSNDSDIDGHLYTATWDLEGTRQ